MTNIGMLTVILLLVSLPVTLSFFGMGHMQSISVTGRLFCNGFPAGNIRVKLYETEVVLDRFMDETRTDLNGGFHVWGHKREFSTIDPQVNFYHRCNYNGICWKKIPIKVPSEFISDGAEPYKNFNVGNLNLALKYPGDSVDCIN